MQLSIRCMIAICPRDHELFQSLFLFVSSSKISGIAGTDLYIKCIVIVISL